MPKIRLLPSEVERDLWLTREEVDRLIVVFHLTLAAVVRFVLATGCRAREVAGWSRPRMERREVSRRTGMR